MSSSGYTITCTVNFIPNSSWQQRRRPWPVGGGLGGRPGGRNAARATCGSWCAAWPAPPGVGAWEQVSPHSLRHSAITFALDAGASLRDVQDYAGHKDPRTTRRYDHSRDSLDRNAAYAVAAYLA